MLELDRENIKDSLILKWKQISEKLGSAPEYYKHETITKCVTIRHQILRDNLVKFLNTKNSEDKKYLISDKDVNINSFEFVGDSKSERILERGEKAIALAKIDVLVSTNNNIGLLNILVDTKKELGEIFLSKNTSKRLNGYSITINIIAHKELICLLTNNEYESLSGYANTCIKNNALKELNKDLIILTTDEYKDFLAYKDSINNSTSTIH